jgi:uncharacterized coiled-coil protein SlyX
MSGASPSDGELEYDVIDRKAVPPNTDGTTTKKPAAEPPSGAPKGEVTHCLGCVGGYDHLFCRSQIADVQPTTDDGDSKNRANAVPEISPQEEKSGRTVRPFGETPAYNVYKDLRKIFKELEFTEEKASSLPGYYFCGPVPSPLTPFSVTTCGFDWPICIDLRVPNEEQATDVFQALRDVARNYQLNGRCKLVAPPYPDLSATVVSPENSIPSLQKPDAASMPTEKSDNLACPSADTCSRVDSGERPFIKTGYIPSITDLGTLYEIIQEAVLDVQCCHNVYDESYRRQRILKDETTELDEQLAPTNAFYPDWFGNISELSRDIPTYPKVYKGNSQYSVHLREEDTYKIHRRGDVEKRRCTRTVGLTLDREASRANYDYEYRHGLFALDGQQYAMTRLEAAVKQLTRLLSDAAPFNLSLGDIVRLGLAIQKRRIHPTDAKTANKLSPLLQAEQPSKRVNEKEEGQGGGTGKGPDREEDQTIKEAMPENGKIPHLVNILQKLIVAVKDALDFNLPKAQFIFERYEEEMNLPKPFKRKQGGGRYYSLSYEERAFVDKVRGLKTDLIAFEEYGVCIVGALESLVKEANDRLNNPVTDENNEGDKEQDFPSQDNQCVNCKSSRYYKDEPTHCTHCMDKPARYWKEEMDSLRSHAYGDGLAGGRSLYDNHDIKKRITKLLWRMGQQTAKVDSLREIVKEQQQLLEKNGLSIPKFNVKMKDVDRHRDENKGNDNYGVSAHP